MLEYKLAEDHLAGSIFRKYLFFLCLGLIYFLLKMLIAPQEIIDGFLRVFFLNLLFLTLIFLLDWIVSVYCNKLFIQYLVIYFLSGFCGLFLIDWLVFGNYEIANIIGQLFMFSYWSGIAVLPKLIMRDYKREEFYLDMFIWIGGILGIFISLGGLAYFFLHRGVFWQVSIMLFFIFLNVYYWHEFIKIFNEEKEIANEEKNISAGNETPEEVSEEENEDNNESEEGDELENDEE